VKPSSCILALAMALNMAPALAAPKAMTHQDVCIYDGSLVQKIAFARDNGIAAADMGPTIDEDLRREPGFSPYFRTNSRRIIRWVYASPYLDGSSAMRSYYDDCMAR
jgi:hypothetical protein